MPIKAGTTWVPGSHHSLDQGPPQLSSRKASPSQLGWGGAPRGPHRPGCATSEGPGSLPSSACSWAQGTPLGSRPVPHSLSENWLKLAPLLLGKPKDPFCPLQPRSQISKASSRVPSPGGPSLAPSFPGIPRIPCLGTVAQACFHCWPMRWPGGELSPERLEGPLTSPSPCSMTPICTAQTSPTSLVHYTFPQDPRCLLAMSILDLSRNTQGPSPEPPPSPLQVPTYPQLTWRCHRI